MVVAVCRDVADAFTDDAGVGNLEFDDEDILFMFGVRLRNVRGPGEEFAATAMMPRITPTTPANWSSRPTWHCYCLHLREHLLCRTERRGVGRGAAQDACHVAPWEHGSHSRALRPVPENLSGR